MTIRTKTIGRMPQNKSEWDPNYVNPGTGQRGYGQKFRVFRYGCELESKIENNIYDPFDWDGDQNFVLDVAHWELCSGNPLVWAAGNPKPAASEEYPYNGMGRVVIPKNMVNIAEQGEPENIVNLLTQDAFEDGEGNPLADTVFVIQYDFVLGENINVPANCVLGFDGGSIANSVGNNYTVGGHFSIKDCHYQIFKNMSFAKNQTYLGIDFIRPEWFGAKGDYDYNSGIGTDDSNAIGQAIKNANISKVNKVKFSALSYYVSEPIEITSGDIILEGVYATLREEDKFDIENDITPERNSCLITNNNIAIIHIGNTVTHPIQVRHLNFRNTILYAETNAIEFSSTFSGPTWPVLIEYCRFHGFGKAIYVNSGLPYCIHRLTIRFCAFWCNLWCVYFNDGNHSYSIDIYENDFHQNVRYMKLASSLGNINIYRNNLENDTPQGIAPDGNYLVDIVLFNEAKLNFYENFFEANITPILRVSTDSYPNFSYSDFSAYGNIFSGDNANYYYTLNGAFNILSADTLLVLSGHFTSKTIPNNVKVSGDTMIAFDNFDLSLESVVKEIAAETWFEGGNPEFINKVITRKYNGAAYANTFSPTKNTPCYIVMITDNGFKRRNVVNSFIFSDDSGTNQLNWQHKGFRYSASIKYYENGITSQAAFHIICFPDVNGVYNRTYQVLSASDGKKLEELFEPTNTFNNITSSELNNITGMVKGDKVFINDTNKELTYNGSAWVDANGNTPT